MNFLIISGNTDPEKNEIFSMTAHYREGVDPVCFNISSPIKVFNTASKGTLAQLVIVEAGDPAHLERAIEDTAIHFKSSKILAAYRPGTTSLTKRARFKTLLRYSKAHGVFNIEDGVDALETEIYKLTGELPRNLKDFTKDGSQYERFRTHIIRSGLIHFNIQEAKIYLFDPNIPDQKTPPLRLGQHFERILDSKIFSHAGTRAGYEGQEYLHLTLKECLLLNTLHQGEGAFFSKEKIAQNIFRNPSTEDERSIEDLILSLRKKIEHLVTGNDHMVQYSHVYIQGTALAGYSLNSEPSLDPSYIIIPAQ